MNTSGASVPPRGHIATTTSSTRMQINPKIHFDCNYFSKIDGQLKFFEILLSCVVLFVMTQTYPRVYASEGYGYETLRDLCDFVILWNTIFIILYMFHVTEKFLQIPWFIIELVSAAFFGVLYFLCGLLFISYMMYRHSGNTVLLFMTVVLASIFIYDAYIKFRYVQGGQISLGRIFIESAEIHQSGSWY